MVTRRPGRSMLGCLFSLLLLVTAVYFGLNLAEPHWRYYRFRDAMAQMARFGGQLTDAEMVSRLRLKADTLGLPPEAHQIRVTRTDRSVTIAVDYGEIVELPLYTRHYTFRARVESPL